MATKLKTETIEMINDALSQYDAHIDNEGRIVSNNSPSNIQIIKKGSRLNYVDFVTGKKYASTNVVKSGVEWFVESFWYWKKK